MNTQIAHSIHLLAKHTAHPARSIEPERAPTALAQERTHHVQAGERLSDLVRQHRVSADAIVAANPQSIRDADLPLVAGDLLTIPHDSRTRLIPYVVQPGQTLEHILATHGVDAEEVARNNGFASGPSPLLYPGDELLLPDAAAASLQGAPASPATPFAAASAGFANESQEKMFLFARHFETIDSARGGAPDGVVSVDDLEYVVEHPEKFGGADSEVVKTAQYLLDHSELLDHLDGADDGGHTDGRIWLTDLAVAMAQEQPPAGLTPQQQAAFTSAQIQAVLDAVSAKNYDPEKAAELIGRILAGAPNADPAFAGAVVTALGAQGLQKLLDTLGLAGARIQFGESDPAAASFADVAAAPVQALLGAAAQTDGGASVITAATQAIVAQIQHQPPGPGPQSTGLAILLGASSTDTPLPAGTLAAIAAISHAASSIDGSPPLGGDLHADLLNALADNPEAALDVLRDPALAENLFRPPYGNDSEAYGDAVERLLTRLTDHVLNDGDFADAAELVILLDGAVPQDVDFGGIYAPIAEALGKLLPVLATGIDPSNRDARAQELEASGIIGRLVEAGLLEEGASGQDVLDLMEAKLTGIVRTVAENDDARAALTGAIGAQVLILLATLLDTGALNEPGLLPSVTEELQAIVKIFGTGLFGAAMDAEAAAAAAEAFLKSIIGAPLGTSIPGLPPGVASRLGKIPTAAADRLIGGIVDAFINIKPGLTQAEVRAEIETAITDAVNEFTYEVVLADNELFEAVVSDPNMAGDIDDAVAKADVDGNGRLDQSEKRALLIDLSDDADGQYSPLLRTLQSGFREAITLGLASAYVTAHTGG